MVLLKAVKCSTIVLRMATFRTRSPKTSSLARARYMASVWSGAPLAVRGESVTVNLIEILSDGGSIVFGEFDDAGLALFPAFGESCFEELGARNEVSGVHERLFLGFADYENDHIAGAIVEDRLEWVVGVRHVGGVAWLCRCSQGLGIYVLMSRLLTRAA